VTERDGRKGASVQFPVSLQLFLGREPFATDEVGRKDGLKSDEVTTVVTAEIEAKIAVTDVVATRVIAADAAHFEQVRIFAAEIRTTVPGFQTPGQGCGLPTHRHPAIETHVGSVYCWGNTDPAAAVGSPLQRRQLEQVMAISLDQFSQQLADSGLMSREDIASFVAALPTGGQPLDGRTAGAAVRPAEDAHRVPGPASLRRQGQVAGPGQLGHPGQTRPGRHGLGAQGRTPTHGTAGRPEGASWGPSASRGGWSSSACGEWAGSSTG
jgi:hypothetical protein